MKNLWKRCLAAVTALLMTAGTLGITGLAGAEQVSAAEDTVEVTFNFDYSSLGTQEALAQAGIDLDMPGVTVEVPKEETLEDALKKADQQNPDMGLVMDGAFAEEIYGLGELNEGSDVAINLGWGNMPAVYNEAGWMYTVSGEVPDSLGLYIVEGDTEVDFRYALMPKSPMTDGAYDWDFIDAYEATSDAIEAAKQADDSGFSEVQKANLRDKLKKAEEVKSDIDSQCEEQAGVKDLWVNYCFKTSIWGDADSPTEKLKTAAAELNKAVEGEVAPESIEAYVGDIYVGERTRINVKVLPDGASQEVEYSITGIGGDVEISNDGYVTGKQAGLIMIEITSKNDPEVSLQPVLIATVKEARVYDTLFKTDEGRIIAADDITLKYSSGNDVSPEDGIYKLKAGEYTYEVAVNEEKIKKVGTLIVNHEKGFKSEAQNVVTISYDTSAEEKAYKETGEFISKNLAPDYGDWHFMGLARGKGVTDAQSEAYYEKTVKYVKSLEDDRSYPTDYARVILALTAAGYDVTDVGGINLLEKLSDMDYVTNQGVNGAIYTLIALDSHDYEIPSDKNRNTQTTREGLVNYILKSQNASGGWNWDTSSDEADVDMTAMALQGLAPYYENAEVKSACDKGIKVLSDMQEPDGTYVSWGSKNASSIAETIVALTALGINPNNDVNFVKNGNSLIDGLNSLAVAGGGYEYNGVLDSDFATRSGYYAMVAYNRYLDGETSLYDMSDVEIRQNNVDTDEGAGSQNTSSNNGNDSAGNANSGDNTAVAGVAQTGDVFPIEIILFAMTLAAIGAVCVVIIRKKRI